MKHVTVSCTGCERQLKLPTEVIGGTVRCPLCQTEFLTVGDSHGNVEAVPLASAGAPKPAGPRPLAPILVDEPPPEPAGLPSLSIDDVDEVPLAPLAPITPELQPLDDEEDVPRARPAPPPPIRKTLPAGKPFSAVRFVVFIQRDPDGRLDGRFQAEATPDGLRIWRGKGRIIEVPRGSPAEHRKGSRLTVEIEGRMVDLTVIHDRDAIGLAGQLADFLSGESDTVDMPTASAWPFIPFALLPVGVPFLAAAFGDNSAGPLGIALWSCFTAAVVGVALLFVFIKSWSGLARGLLTGLLVFLSYFALAAGLIIDKAMGPGGIPASNWAAFAGHGFSVQMPGRPTSLKRPQAGFAEFEEFTLTPPGRDLTYRVLAGRYSDPGNPADHFVPARRRDEAINTLVTVGGTFSTGRNNLPAPAPGIEAAEVSLRGPGTLNGLARVYAGRQRVVVVIATSKSLPANHADITRMVFSANVARMADGGGKDGPKEGGPKAVPPKDKDREKPPDTGDLNNGGWRMSAERDQYVWAGFRPDGRIVAVKQRGGHATWDRPGLNPDTRPAPGDDEAHAADLHGTRLAYAGLNGNYLSIVPLDGPHAPLGFADGYRGKALWGVAFSADGKWLATAHGDQKVRIWDAEKRTFEREIASGTNQVLSVAFSPDGGLLAAANADLKIRVHDPKTGVLVATCEGHQAVRPPFDGVRDWRWNVRSLSFSRDGRTLVSAGNDETARVWDATTGALVQTIRHPAPVTAAAFHPAGRIVVTGSSDGRLRFFDAATGAERGRGIGRPGGAYHSIRFNADGGLLVAVRAGQVERWEWMRHADLRPEDTRNVEALPRNVSRLTLPGGPAIQRVEVAAAGSRLAVHTTDNKLHLYAGTPPRPVRVLTLNEPTGELVFSPDGKRLALGTRTGTVVFDAEKGEAVATFEHPNETPPIYAFTPDGSRLLMAVQAHPATRRACLRVFDLASKSERPPIYGVQARSWIAVSPDGLALATATPFTKPFHLYEAATGREYARLTGHDWGTFRTAWTPDGKTLVSLGQTDGVRIWDAAAGRQRFNVTGDGLAIGRGPGHLAISPDGKTIAAALHAASFVAVIDLPSGTRLATLKPPGGNVTGLGFGEDGKTLHVAGTGDAIDRYDLTRMPELQKRPAPRAADLEKSPAAEVPDLQPAGTAEPHLAAVIDAEGGHAILFTRDRLALHYAYPSMRLRAAVWAGHIVTQAAFDRKKGRVIAATVGLRSLPANSADVRQGHGPLVSFDVKALLEGKPPARLETKEVPLTGKFTALAVSGKWLFALDSKDLLKPAIRRVDLEKFEEAGTAGLAFRPASLALSPDGKKLYAAGQGRPGEGRLARLDAATLKAEKEVDAQSWGTSLAATEKYVLVGGFGAAGDGITVLDATKDDLPKLTRWGGLGVPRAWAAGGRIYMMQRLGAVRITAYPAADTLPATAPTSLAQYTGRPPGDDVTLSPDGSHVLLLGGPLLRMTSGKLEPPATKWDDAAPVKEAGPLAAVAGVLEPPAGRVLGLAWAPDGKHLVAGTSAGEVIGWNASTGKAERRSTSWNLAASAVAVSPDGRSLAAVTWGGELLNFSFPAVFPQGTVRLVLAPGADGIAFGPEGARLFAADAAGLRGWPRAGVPEVRAETPSSVTGVAVSKDGVVAAGALDGVIRLYDAEKCEHKSDLKGHEAEVRAVAWSPDGKRLASVDVAGKLILWDAAAGKAEKTVEAHASAILALAFAPDGKVVATGAADGSRALWDTSGKKLREWKTRPGTPAWAMAFSPDGAILASAEGDGLRRYSTLGVVERVKVVPEGAEPAPASRLPSANRGVIIDTGKGFGLALGSTSFGQITRFTVPGYRTEALFRPDRTIYRLLYDAAGEKVYGFRSATTPIAGTHPRGRNAAVLMFALDKFKGEGKLKGPKGPMLAADKQATVSGTVFCPRLSPDGKHLYWLDADARQVVKFGTALEGKPETLDLKANPVALALSPDGRTLYAVVEGVARRSSLAVIDAVTMKTTATRPLGQEAYDVAAAADGDVVIAGADKLVWASAATPDRPKRQQATAGKRYRVETAAAGKLAVLCPDVSGEVELVVWPLDGRAGGRLNVTAMGRSPQGGDFSITPDGSRVALRSGDIVTLPARWVPK